MRRLSYSNPKLPLSNRALTWGWLARSMVSPCNGAPGAQAPMRPDAWGRAAPINCHQCSSSTAHPSPRLQKRHPTPCAARPPPAPHTLAAPRPHAPRPRRHGPPSPRRHGRSARPPAPSPHTPTKVAKMRAAHRVFSTLVGKTVHFSNIGRKSASSQDKTPARLILRHQNPYQS